MSHDFHLAVVRRPGPDASAGITSAGLGSADPERLAAQHRGYVETLRAAGVEVLELEPLPGHPDAYFVEDVAVVVPEVAVVTRPGAAQRRPEAEAITAALEPLRPLAHLCAPATLDGGDVLVSGREVFVGRSARSNQAGFEQLAAALAPHGYRCVAVEVRESLHLKSGVADLGAGVLLLADPYAGCPQFAHRERVVAPVAESYACNCLRLGERVLMPAGFPRLAAMLAGRGLDPLPLEVGEVRRMDGGLSCMSLRM